MPLIEKAPEIRLLEAAKAALELVTPEEWQEDTGVIIKSIRHSRNRYPTESEKNAISIRWLGNEDHDIDGVYLTEWEKAKRCLIDLEFDLKLRPEESGEDPTGWGDATRVKARALTALREENGPLMLLSDWVIDGDETPDEDSKPDEGRLVKRVSVVYRVRTDNPNRLLARGEQG